MKSVLKRIAQLTETDLKHKTVEELFLSAVEELGELARAMKVEDGVFGNRHKTLDEPSNIEAADLVIMAFALYYARNGLSMNDLEIHLHNKLDKWEKNQKRREKRKTKMKTKKKH